MDPFTQGIVGVTASQSISHKKHLFIASAIGLLAGLAPDVDIFIRSDTDPLLFLNSIVTLLILYFLFHSVVCFVRLCFITYSQNIIILGFCTHTSIPLYDLKLMVLSTLLNHMAHNCIGPYLMRESHGIVFLLLIHYLQYR